MNNKKSKIIVEYVIWKEKCKRNQSMTIAKYYLKRKPGGSWGTPFLQHYFYKIGKEFYIQGIGVVVCNKNNMVYVFKVRNIWRFRVVVGHSVKMTTYEHIMWEQITSKK